jgi:hypothetical protein
MGMIVFNIAPQDPTNASYSVTIGLQRAGMIVVGLWLVYVAAWATTAGAARLNARRRIMRAGIRSPHRLAGPCPERAREMVESSA